MQSGSPSNYAPSPCLLESKKDEEEAYGGSEKAKKGKASVTEQQAMI